MHRFIEGADRAQASLLPAALEGYVDADNSVRVIEAFVDALDLDALGFAMIRRRPDGRATIRQCY